MFDISPIIYHYNVADGLSDLGVALGIIFILIGLVALAIIIVLILGFVSFVTSLFQKGPNNSVTTNHTTEKRDTSFSTKPLNDSGKTTRPVETVNTVGNPYWEQQKKMDKEMRDLERKTTDGYYSEKNMFGAAYHENANGNREYKDGDDGKPWWW